MRTARPQLAYAARRFQVLLQQKCESLNMVVRTELRKDDKTFDYCVSESVTGIRCQASPAPAPASRPQPTYSLRFCLYLRR